MGLEADLESFALSRIEPGPSYLEVGGQRIDGIPMFDGSSTGREGIKGRIGPVGSSVEIGVGQVKLRAGEDEALTASRSAGDHQSLVAITVGGRPGLMLSNAPEFESPFGPPVLQVTSEAQALVNKHAGLHSAAHLVATITREHTESFNVVARLAGEDKTLPPLLVMTPRSGWWQCASERGGGLACWLEVMRTLREAGTQREVIFVPTTAHELGHLGFQAFQQRRPGIVTDAFAWIHFGANVGAAGGPGGEVFATDDDLGRQARSVLERAKVNPVEMAAPGAPLPGESRIVVPGGGRIVTLIGRGNPVFHMECDRWPEVVDVEATARLANGYTDLALQLSRG